MLFTLISPEGHREPNSHHHVGGAAVLRGENSLEITPHLEEHTYTETQGENMDRK